MSDALPKRAILVANAKSRKGDAAFDEARKGLTSAGIELIEAHAMTEPGEMDQAIRQAVGKAPMVIVGGGDGSLSSVIDHFVGADTVFAVLPLGTANSFARTMGIPLELEGAIDVIANGRPKRIDLGMIDGDYFANAAALGLSPLIADTVPPALKRYLGMVGYLIWAVRVAFRFSPFKLRLTLDDGSEVESWATEARIANGTHHGGIELVESQSIDSGELVVQAVTGKSMAALAWSWFSTLFKLRHRRQTVTEWRGKKMRLDSRPRQKISVDGEIAATTPVILECARAAVLVAAPRD